MLRVYAQRWRIERAFQGSKQHLRIENPEVQLPAAVRRTVPFGTRLYSLVILWYVTTRTGRRRPVG